MIETSTLSKRGESDWLDLRHHVEWSRGFALILLFCSNPALLRLYRERLARFYQSRVSSLEVVALDGPETTPDRVMDLIRSPSALNENTGAPVWIDLSIDRDSNWIAARNATVTRLNEHRELMRQRLRRPLILALPVDYRPKLRELAPDLWAIRNFSLDLHTSDHTLIEKVPARSATDASSETLTKAAFAGTSQKDGLNLFLKEWERLKRRGVKDRGTLYAGLTAAEAALANQRLTEAYGITRDTLRMARQLAIEHHSPQTVPQTVRDLSISLDNVGDTARALGRLEEAEAAFGESLELMRAQRERLGDTPEIVRDLSISLEKVGDTARALGRLEEAEAAFGESLELRRAQRESLGDTPEIVRDLSVSLDNLGDTSFARGKLAEAREHYSESLLFWRRLHQAFPTVQEYAEATERLQRRLENLPQDESGFP